jgi:hypothetical protein
MEVNNINNNKLLKCGFLKYRIVFSVNETIYFTKIFSIFDLLFNKF